MEILIAVFIQQLFDGVVTLKNGIRMIAKQSRFCPTDLIFNSILYITKFKIVEFQHREIYPF